MWAFAIIIGAAVAGLAFLALQLSALNNDPIQKELSDLILKMMANGATADAQAVFLLAKARVLEAADIDPSEHQSRLAHALKMIASRLTADDLKRARTIVFDGS